MKTIYCLLTLFVITNAAISQSTVTIITQGNQFKQVNVDDKTYLVNNNASTEQSLVINDLVPGQHTLSAVRTRETRTPVRTSFTLREGFDLTLTIKSNGTVNSTEMRTGRRDNSGLPLSAAAYNRLYSQTKAKTSSTARASFLESEINRLNRTLTSKQASQLIQLVNSESMRLKLAKQSYLKINDQENFHLVFETLTSTSSKNSLNDYLIYLQNGNVDVSDPLTDADFTLIYNEVIGERTAEERIYYLDNYFKREGSHYTAEQARKLILTVPAESDRLNLAKKAYRGVVDRENYYNSIYSVLQYSTSRADLLSYINTYSTGTTTGNAMSSSNFTKLYNTIARSSSASRYNQVAGAFNNTSNFFTTIQARQLILLVNAEPDRLDLAKNAYNNIVDLVNFAQVFDAIASTNGKNELAAFVTRMQSGGLVNTRTPMSESDFNSLYRGVQLTFGFGAKYRSLTEIFNTETNYFTVAQAKELIQLVSSESNRLELAKLSYNNITDSQNFSSIYDIFSSASSKNELMVFVGSSSAGLK